MTQDEIFDLLEASHRRIDKKYADDPSYIIRKRVANTANSVIRKVNNLDFSDLATDIYLICDEVGYKFFLPERLEIRRQWKNRQESCVHLTKNQVHH